VKVLVIGFGDVGRSVTRILLSKNIEVTAVDLKDVIAEGVDFVKGNALSEELWDEIDLSKYSAAVIALPNDVDALLCIMMLKRKREDLLILARCNNPRYREKMSLAGADYVIDLPTVSSQMIVSTIFREEAERRLFYENVHFRTYKIGRNSPIIGKRTDEIGKVLILAVKRGEEVLENCEIAEGDTILVVGRLEDLKRFEEKFITPSKQ